MPNLSQGLTYVGRNAYRIYSPLAGLPVSVTGDRMASFSVDRIAEVAPATMQRADRGIMPTPAAVGGHSSRQVAHSWPVFREFVETRSMNGELTPGDAAALQLRIAKGVEKMIASAFQTGQILWADGESIDVWGSETPEFHAQTPWDAQGGDPLSDILDAADSMTAHGARTASKLFLASDAYRALMKSQEVRDLLDNRRIIAGELKAQKAPAITPLAMPAEIANSGRWQGLAPLTDDAFMPDTGSFGYCGTLAGIEIYRDCAGLITKGSAILMSDGQMSAGKITADYWLNAGFPWVAGSQIRAPQAECALYLSTTPDGSRLDSYSFISLAWANVWGAVHMADLTTP